MAPTIPDDRLTDGEREKRSHFITKLKLSSANMQLSQLDAALTETQRASFEAELADKYKAPAP